MGNSKSKIKLTKTFTAPLLVLVSIILIVGCTNLEKMPPTGKPFVSITADKTYGEAPLNVSFTITAIPARGSIKKLMIDYGDGSSEDLTQKLKENKVYVSHEFKTIGTFRVRVAAIDQNGSAEAEIQITTNDRPIISNLKAYKVIYSPSYSEIVTNEFMPGDNVRIRALCIDQNPPFYGLIDWGDGSVDQILGGCSGIHTYSAEGDYTIRLIVQDSAPQPLSNTASITVKVRYVITPTNRPPELDISLSSTAGEAPFSVTLYVGVADIDGQVAEVKVDWGDGQVENIGDTDKIGERDGRKLYKKEHQYTSQGAFTLTVIAKDDKGEISMETETVIVSSSKPVLSVKFKDHTNADPNGKTYNIDMAASPFADQVTISADILSYDINPYDIVEVIRADYADGSTIIIIDKLYTAIDLRVENNTTILSISPSLISWSPKNIYPSGITINATVTIYAVKSGVVNIPWWMSWSGCQSHPSNDLSECEDKINTIKNHPSAVSFETKFTVKPK